ncbi:RDD family protein [Candidatus Deianiraea vastatrix]|uniref:RDD family protein n=1 Tax=Candidatus Deianiraea vastatrix TaxID=2163644 RepID=A0A5B8XF53_9RICK|nr:RDD family protein [Candidatus Deianiraea vastatrix]QED23545.1 RDD family protein [Candidatus Deianiraea vastatrix]
MKLVITNIYKRGIAFVVDEMILCVARVSLLTFIYTVFFQGEEMKKTGEEISITMAQIPETASLPEVWHVLTSLKITIWIELFIGIFFIVSPIYQFYMYYFKNGQTIGKKVVGIVVLKADEMKMSAGDIVLRMVLSYVPWILPLIVYILYANGSLMYVPLLIVWFFWYDPWIFFGKKGKTLHDVLSNTYVFNVPSLNSITENSSVDVKDSA